LGGEQTATDTGDETVNKRIPQLFAAALSLLVLTEAGSALAGPATEAVKGTQSALFGLIQQGAPGAQPKIDALVDDMIDYDALAKASLGAQWAPRSKAEQDQFTDLLKQLTRRSYQRSLKQIVGYNVQYLSEVPVVGGGLLVNSQAVSKTDPRAAQVEIGFSVENRGGKWKVVDILTDGDSLTVSYRGQFGKIIAKDGFPAVIQKMKDKLASP
jgi:phospholipid transport system substrate-binding protein